MEKEHHIVSGFFLSMIIVIAIIMRFYNYDLFSYSNDELSALFRLQYDSFSDLIQKGVWPDGHPAGVQVFLYYWTQLGGLAEGWVRLPFIIAGILAVIITYLIGAKWFGKFPGLFSAAAVAILIFPLTYSQIARPYSLGLLFCLLNVLTWTYLIQNISVKFIHYGVYVMTAIICCYLHYFSFLVALIVGITGLFLLSKEKLKYYLVSAVVVALLFLPHLSVTLNHLSIGGVGGKDGWLGKPDVLWLPDYIFYMLNDSVYVVVVLFVVSIYGMFRFKLKSFSKYQLIAILWFILPFLIAYIYSIYVNPVLQASVMIFSMPFFFLFFFSFINNSKNKVVVFSMLSVFIATSLYSTTIEKSFYKVSAFGVFKELAVAIEDWYKEYNGNITYSININHPYGIYFYLENTQIDFVQTRNDKRRDLGSLTDEVKKAQTAYFSHSWSTKINAPEIYDVIAAHYPYLIAHRQYNNSAISLFSKFGDDAMKLTESVVLNDFEDGNTWGKSDAGLNSMTSHSGKLSYYVNENIEYASTYQNVFAVGSRYSISVWFKLTDTINDVLLVACIKEQDKSYHWRKVNLQDYNRRPSEWNQAFLHYEIKDIDIAGNKFNFVTYIWNPDKANFHIDDFGVRQYLNTEIFSLKYFIP